MTGCSNGEDVPAEDLDDVNSITADLEARIVQLQALRAEESDVLGVVFAGPVGSAEEQQLELLVQHAQEKLGIVAAAHRDWDEGRKCLADLADQLAYVCAHAATGTLQPASTLLLGLYCATTALGKSMAELGDAAGLDFTPAEYDRIADVYSACYQCGADTPSDRAGPELAATLQAETGFLAGIAARAAAALVRVDSTIQTVILPSEAALRCSLEELGRALVDERRKLIVRVLQCVACGAVVDPMRAGSTAWLRRQ